MLDIGEVAYGGFSNVHLIYSLNRLNSGTRDRHCQNVPKLAFNPEEEKTCR
jgi:hypothetical protein